MVAKAMRRPRLSNITAGYKGVFFCRGRAKPYRAELTRGTSDRIATSMWISGQTEWPAMQDTAIPPKEGKESAADLLTVKDFMPQPWSQLI